jgi:hypothetical protein
MRRIALAGAVLGLAFATSSGAALAVPAWWVKGSSGPYKELPVKTTETLTSAGTMKWTSPSGKGTCKGLTDKETIENPKGGGAGTDTMTAFEVSCPKAAFYPCNKAETASLKVKGSGWPSMLIETSPGEFEDEFTMIRIEATCSATGTKEIYAGAMNALVKPNQLDFRAGVLNAFNQGDFLTMTLKDKVTAAKYTKVTAQADI